MIDHWEATARAASRIERAAEAHDFSLARDELQGIVARFGHAPDDNSPGRVALALARACLAAIDAEDDEE